MQTDLLSIVEAAQRIGVSGRRVRALCEKGRIGRKVGPNWVVTAAEADRMRAELAQDSRSDQQRTLRAGA
jgi:hypothetical protein